MGTAPRRKPQLLRTGQPLKPWETARIEGGPGLWDNQETLPAYAGQHGSRPLGRDGWAVYLSDQGRCVE